MGTKTAPGRYDCLAKAELDEPVFVLLARDPHAPELIDAWAAERATGGENAEKVMEAVGCAEAMRVWRLANSTPCGDCGGNGYTAGELGERVTCAPCHGSGRQLAMRGIYFAGSSSVPDTIVVGAARYTLLVDQAAIDKAAVEMGYGVQGKLCGHHSHAGLTITLHPDQPADGARDSLLHEVLHALASQTDLNRDWAEHDEAFVARLTPALLALLRANPALVQFLTSDPGGAQ